MSPRPSEMQLLPINGEYGDAAELTAIFDFEDMPLRFDDEALDGAGIGYLSRPLDSDHVQYL